jgi:hypothetical protein
MKRALDLREVEPELVSLVDYLFWRAAKEVSDFQQGVTILDTLAQVTQVAFGPRLPVLRLAPSTICRGTC